MSNSLAFPISSLEIRKRFHAKARSREEEKTNFRTLFFGPRYFHLAQSAVWPRSRICGVTKTNQATVVRVAWFVLGARSVRVESG